MQSESITLIKIMISNTTEPLPFSEDRAGKSPGHHLPMTDVNSSGAELPAAMNVAPATSSLRFRRYRGARTKHR